MRVKWKDGVDGVDGVIKKGLTQVQIWKYGKDYNPKKILRETDPAKCSYWYAHIPLDEMFDPSNRNPTRRTSEEVFQMKYAEMAARRNALSLQDTLSTDVTGKLAPFREKKVWPAMTWKGRRYVFKGVGIHGALDFEGKGTCPLYMSGPPAVIDLRYRNDDPGRTQPGNLGVGGENKTTTDRSSCEESVAIDADQHAPLWSNPEGSGQSAHANVSVGDAGIAAIAKAQKIGIRRFIADTGSGIHLIPMEKVKSGSLRKHLHKLPYPFKLDTAGGETQCGNTLAIKFSALGDNELVAHVLDDTPPVISIGRICMTRGYSFHWPSSSQRPYFESPDGKCIYLEVDDFIPYIVNRESSCAARLYPGDGSTVAGTQAAPAFDVPAPPPPHWNFADIHKAPNLPDGLRRWAHVGMEQTTFLGDFEAFGIPAFESLERRVTMDLHTREVIGDLSGLGGYTLDKLTGPLPNAPRDIITYVHYKPAKIVPNEPVVAKPEADDPETGDEMPGEAADALVGDGPPKIFPQVGKDA